MARKKNISVCVIGAGLIGKERLMSLRQLIKKGRKVEIAGIFDPYAPNKDEIAKEFNTKFFDSLDALFAGCPDWIFIATPHDDAVEIAKKALAKGFKVLVEKPLGRSYKEAKSVFDCTTKKNQLWVGFNYRFFDGIAAALKDIRQKKFGDLISLNILMGHGGNPKDKLGWKLDPVKAGGGCLIDPGVHLLDICQLIAKGKLEVMCGMPWKGFWKTGIEEETNLLLRFGKTAINFQVSIVKWASTFRMEINGTKKYGIVTGRNRSYGDQKYIIGEKWGWMKGGSQKDSEKEVLTSANTDSFTKEIEALLFGNQTKNSIKPCSGEEALAVMELLDRCRKILKLPV
ncbi:MAG: Gfo/Idh/MocA family oxidoreductase [Candidatus Moranbacteria bacterium]|nr:Gfo/Idh/MocA family oxidoreductase [Candidatus Moranbacteria bacterium]